LERIAMIVWLWESAEGKNWGPIKGTPGWETPQKELKPHPLLINQFKSICQG